MNDAFQLIVDQQHIHKVLTHEGLLGKGRDFITGQNCSLHLYNDRFKKTYVMQQFNDISQNFINEKMARILKTAHNKYISNVTKVCFISTRKNNQGLFDLCIFYDATGVYGYSLEYIIKMKIKNQQKFSQDEIIGFFWQISDYLLFCGQSTGQHLEITPVNIFCRADDYYGYNYFPNNFGLSFDHTKWQRKYNNPKDRFWKGQQKLQSALKTTMFTFGMVLLQLCCLLSPSSLYTGNQINEKILKKRIQAIKLINNPQICWVISSLLNMNEDQRLTIKQIYENKQLIKLRKADYYSSKGEYCRYKSFEGLVFFDRKHAIGQILNQQMNIERGNFEDGKLDGLGMKENKEESINVGVFQKGLFKEGIIFTKDDSITILSDSQKTKKGVLLKLDMSVKKQSRKTMVAFEGQFQNFKPSHGKVYFNDGSEEQV